jgi:hypothetical protein
MELQVWHQVDVKRKVIQKMKEKKRHHKDEKVPWNVSW